MKMQALIQRAITILILAAPLLVWLSAPLAGQTAGRIWAAQTGPDQVTLAWDPIPGAMEYRIYLGAPSAPGDPVERKPEIRLSNSSRGAILTRIQRLSNGIYLAATDASGQAIHQAQFNQVSAATAFPPLASPTQVKATASGATEVAVSWSAVPGATAYFIGRAVGGSGFSAICNLCSTDTHYVDRGAVPGLTHAYTISAIFPNGISRRINSNQVTPGATQVAATTTPQPTVSTSTPITAILPVNSIPSGVSGAWGSLTNSFAPGGTPVASTQPAAVNTGIPNTTNQTTTNQIGVALELTGRMREMLNNIATGVGAATAATIGQMQEMTNSIANALSIQMMQATTTTHSATPVTATPTTATASSLFGGISGQLVGTLAQQLPTTTATQTTAVHTATPVTATPTTATASSLFGGISGQLAGTLAAQINPVSAPTGATPQTTAVPTAMQNTNYVTGGVPSGVSGASGSLTNTFTPGGTPVSTTLAQQPPTTTATPTTVVPPGTPVTATPTTATASNLYGGISGQSTGMFPTPINPVSTPTGTATQTTPVHAATPIAPPCKLDYQRADNMWADLGKPDGQLGTETISLLAGQNKAFDTDWKYEKTRNNGTSFYGSHLRIATNSSSGTVRMRVRALEFTGLDLTMRSLWTTMAPGATKQFRADLVEVSCEQ